MWSSGSKTAPEPLQEGSCELEVGADFPYSHFQCDPVSFMAPGRSSLGSTVMKQGKVSQWTVSMVEKSGGEESWFPTCVLHWLAFTPSKLTSAELPPIDVSRHGD